jgi:predicted esterase YcpF (UPF0227 family)
MKKIVFLHGFYASGQCVPAVALREAFAGRAEVITPDLPMHPKEAVGYIRELIGDVKPDLLIGNSCGAFYAQMVAPVVGIPALLGNPHFQMTEFLKQRIGEHEYKSPRKDGNQKFVIDEALINEFAEMETIQFDSCHPDFRDRIWGLFGEKDTLAHFEPFFLEHYNHSFHFPGGHTPTADEVSTWYVPLAEKLLQIERIKQMEQRFNKALAVVHGVRTSPEMLEAIKEDVAILDAYYGSGEWRQDFADDEAGLLPKELKRGVLSEDGIWNLLSAYREW